MEPGDLSGIRPYHPIQIMDANAAWASGIEATLARSAVRGALIEALRRVGGVDRLKRGDLDQIIRAGVRAAKRFRRDQGYVFQQVRGE